MLLFLWDSHSDIPVLLKLLVGSLMQLRHGIVSWFHSPSGGLLRILESREGQTVEYTVQSVDMTMALALVNTANIGVECLCKPLEAIMAPAGGKSQSAVMIE